MATFLMAQNLRAVLYEPKSNAQTKTYYIGIKICCFFYLVDNQGFVKKVFFLFF